MDLTEDFLREALLTVRDVAGSPTGYLVDAEMMRVYGPIIAAIIQARTAIWLGEDK